MTVRLRRIRLGIAGVRRGLVLVLAAACLLLGGMSPKVVAFGPSSPASSEVVRQEAAPPSAFSVPLPGEPAHLAYDGADHLYVLNRRGGRLHDLDVSQRAHTRSASVAPLAVSVRAAGGGTALWLLRPERAALDIIDAATLTERQSIDLSPWLERTSRSPDALLVADNGTQALIHGQAPLLLDSGARWSSYGAVVTVEGDPPAVTRAVPVFGGREGSFNIGVFAGDLGTGLEGIAVYVRGSEAGILYSTDLGSGTGGHSTIASRPECGVLDEARSAFLVYASLHLSTTPISSVVGGTPTGSGTRQVLDLRFPNPKTIGSTLCRIAIDTDRDIAYFLDAHWGRLVTIDLRTFTVLAEQHFESRMMDLALLPAHGLLAITFPDRGEVAFQPVYVR